ncbi:hypothetical protein ABT56_21530 [Photobacterium aquae]|uniref:PhaC PHA synthase n=1 Tax=Photobacterium aquae TaxID=1195763 RepID=A0A0J1GRI2_9GAMM|nr:hypothetical protein [Photobacterium aquae]KLV02335.1 hypothetical protein ABT56_21530 [Photobacterium aquae]
MKKALLGTILASSIAFPAFAAQPVQLSVPGNNLPAGDVHGFRASLFYGQTPSVTGFQLPILGLAESSQFKGLSVGVLFGANRVTNDSVGAKFGLANWNDNRATGADIGFLNYTGNQFTGLQFGTVNYAGSLNGVQFGFINATDHINKGVQIGLINYDKSGTFVSKNLPVFPIINARF